MMIEAALALRQTHPSVYVRLHDGAPSDFVDLAVRYILEGENRAQIYGDDNVIRALAADGVPIADARHWCAGGCMEVGMQGMSGDLLFAFAHNTPRTLELILNGGRLLQSGDKAIEHTKTLADYRSFDDLLRDFEAEFVRELRVLMRRLDVYLECYAKYRPSFLLSAMVHDCLDRGRNINDGGARHPHYGGSAVGIPNVGDSLYAVKRVVFDDRHVSGAELLETLCANFKGHEALRTYLLNLPKFGAENAEADAMTDRVMRLYNRTIKAHRNPQGGHCRPIILGFTWVVSMGLQVGATPDGRLAGQPLAQSLSPQSGAAMKGLTGAINSATSLSLHEVSGGASMMWDLDVNWATPEVVRPVLLTFFQKGGHIFQGNVMDVSVLREAQKTPERFRDLMVRVGGFSARFVTLSKETQEEVITRYKYRDR
jgi:formate C-acetyltransferase